jgi:hypoxanthine phosphoribosyltransferase
MTETEIRTHVKTCAKALDEKFGGIPVIFVCILKGAAWFFADLTRELMMPNYTTYFVEASSYKNSQTQSETIEILSRIVPEKFVGRKVVLVDELYDNGTTMEHLKKAISEKAQVPYEDIMTCAVFKKNRSDSHTYLGTLDLYGTIVPNVWLVGYGLDDQQKKRGFRHLFAVPKSDDMEKTEDDLLIFK